MSKLIAAEGACLCGAVQVSAGTINVGAVGACHCTSCRKWGSGPYLSVECGTEVSFSGEENLSVFDSSDWAERGFCSLCGGHLFYRLKENGQHFMPAALFGDRLDYVFDHQIFIDEKPSYYSFANKTDDMTGPEVFAKYGAPPE